MMSQKKLWLIFCLVSSAACHQTPSDPLGHTPGAVAYRKNCISCHLPQGQGIAGVQPPLAQTPVPIGDPQALLGWVMFGQRPAALPAGQYSGQMPQFQYLSDQELADLLTYVRHSFGNQASEITVDQVKAARQAHSQIPTPKQ
jgi:mono/diheme cytochrome c family protein